LLFPDGVNLCHLPLSGQPIIKLVPRHETAPLGSIICVQPDRGPPVGVGQQPRISPIRAAIAFDRARL
jgi:hypothetical protein